jgi:NitT/TauT family transport system substrate-binding protein
MVTLRMNISNNTSYGPIYIAESEGYFKEFGIQMEFIQINKSPEALALLVSGDIDVYAGVLLSGILNVISQDPTIKVVADRGHIAPGGCTYQAIVVRKDLFDSGVVTSAEDLKGLPISLTASGPSGFMASSYLMQAGLSLDDIVISEIPSAALVDAFNNETLAATSSAEPVLTTLMEAGNAVLLAKAEDVLGVYQSGLMVFGKKLTVDDPELGARFLAGYLKGIEQYNQGKTERNLQIMADKSGETLEVLKKACWPAMRQDGTIDYKGVEPFQNWSIENGYLENAVTQSQFYDPGFLEAAWVLLK